MTMVLPPDLESFLCAHLRAHLTDVPGLQAGDKRPQDYTGTFPLVVVRDDGGSQAERVMFDRSLGVTVTAGTRSNNGPAKRLARRVYALLTDPSIVSVPGSPICAVVEDGCNGPYPVSEELDVACYYLAVEYSAVGDIQDQ